MSSTATTQASEDPVYSIPNLTKTITSILKEIIEEESKESK